MSFGIDNGLNGVPEGPTGEQAMLDEKTERLIDLCRAKGFYAGIEQGQVKLNSYDWAIEFNGSEDEAIEFLNNQKDFYA